MKEQWDAEDDANPANQSPNPTFASVLAARLSRRDLLRGASGAAALLATGALGGPRGASAQPAGEFTPLTRSTEDKLIVPPGYADPIQFQTGNPYGTSHASAAGPPDETALEAARFQARRAVDTAAALKAGRAA